MSGFDKMVIMENLKKLGWKEFDGYDMIPPDELFNNLKGRTFYVYDARDLQEILGGEIENNEP